MIRKSKVTIYNIKRKFFNIEAIHNQKFLYDYTLDFFLFDTYYIIPVINNNYILVKLKVNKKIFNFLSTLILLVISLYFSNKKCSFLIIEKLKIIPSWLRINQFFSLSVSYIISLLHSLFLTYSLVAKKLKPNMSKWLYVDCSDWQKHA
jgi:hypothetical protein